METITIILGIVMLVFGILQIILFFKVWGMTNNVKEMNQRQEQIHSLLQLIASKESNKTNIETTPQCHQQHVKTSHNDDVVENVHVESKSGLDEDSKKNLENAIRNGNMQVARYILMIKCKMSLEKADEFIKSAQR